MTAYPVAANHLHWWLATSTSGGRCLHAVPREALDPADEDAVEALCSGPYPVMTAACGRTREWAMPGVLSRLAMARCLQCCVRLRIGCGAGTPANESDRRDGSDGRQGQPGPGGARERQAIHQEKSLHVI